MLRSRQEMNNMKEVNRVQWILTVIEIHRGDSTFSTTVRPRFDFECNALQCDIVFWGGPIVLSRKCAKEQ
eukprot:scaffold26366_cov117-Cylindrotheca_fusiformis.AAC.4